MAADRAELLDGLTEFDATFPARDARAVALERSAGVPIADALEPLRELRDVEEILVLAEASVSPLSAALVIQETERLDHELGERGGKLSDEQRAAIELACGTRRFVVIEGHAGTGKSTTLTGVARVHQASGREIVVTSTAALAAERLAGELTNAGVEASAYSTAALQAAINTGLVRLGADTTIIHDEAALASTREQQQLLQAVETAGARLIEIGDPRQNHPVGAGGLWPHLETAARHAGAHIALTRNQRAQDPADRRDQALFRDGRHEHAIRGYAARQRVHITGEKARAEDHALDAAHNDRQARKTTIVIAQTSNEHLDELNARAQAIRHEHGELEPEALPLPGRPYQLHPGDEVQIRRTIPHPNVGQLRNGATANVVGIDAGAETVALRLADGRTITLDRDQAVRADVRLAYVQHPFPAQGQTTDTAHLIIGEHTTQEGSYVALTRAHEQTHIHAAHTPHEPPDTDRLQALAERMSRTEPDLPSIHTPLAHQTAITAEQARTGIEAQHDIGTPALEVDPTATSAPPIEKPEIRVSAASVGARGTASEIGAHDRVEAELEQQSAISRKCEAALDRAANDVHEEHLMRTWPRARSSDLATRDLAEEKIEGGYDHGWEP